MYNKNPNVYIKIQLGPFIVKLVDELEQQQQSLYQLRSSENVEELRQPIDPEEERRDPGSQQSRRIFHHVCHKAALRLTALLLSIEQGLNDENPNVPSFRTIPRAQALMAQMKIDDKVFRQVKVWLQSPVFLDRHIPPAIRITFLQVLYLVVSANGALEKLRGETLLNFISDMISQVAKRGEESKESAQTGAAAATSVTPRSTSTAEELAYGRLEDGLVMMTISKLLYAELQSEEESTSVAARKGHKISDHLLGAGPLKQLFQIVEQRPHCSTEVRYIFAKLQQKGGERLAKKVPTPSGNLP